MSFPSVTYTFSNGSTADASQVNQNFTDLINGISDTTKDISVSALTAASTATLNGNTILGNSSSKTVTFNASLASTIPISANNSYNIGSSTLGLASVYLGSAGGFTTRLVSAATASWTLTLPVTAGTANAWLTTNGSGTTSWARGISVLTKTTTYTVLTTDDIIFADTSGAGWTLTIYTPVGNTGNVIRIKKTSNDVNVLTVSPAAALIDGSATTTMNTRYETLTLISDGTNWQIMERRTKSTPTTYTPTISAGFGTTSSLNVLSWRDGRMLKCAGNFTAGTVAASAAQITPGFGGTNSNVSMDTTLLGVEARPIGVYGTGASQILGFMIYINSSVTIGFGTPTAVASPCLSTTNVNQMASNGVTVSFYYEVPISGWKE